MARLKAAACASGGRHERVRAASTSHQPLFAEARGDIEVSFEFFPPKTEKMAETLWESIQTLAPLHPRFVSVTYGAGGSTRERTHATVERIVNETDAHARRASDLRRRDARAKSTRSRAIIGSSACATSSRCAAIRPSRARITAAPGRLSPMRPSWSPA